MKAFVAALLVLPSLAFGGPFITGNGSLPATKTDRTPLQPGADVTKAWSASDANAAIGALYDLRDHTTGWLNVKSSAIGVKCDGSTNDTAALGVGAGLAATAGVGLLIPCKMRLSSAAGSVTVPLRFEGGGSLDLRTGGSITLAGELVAGLHQIFYSNGGALTYTAKTHVVFPQWWGAKADGSTDDSTAINAALWAAFQNGGGTVQLPPGTYAINEELRLDTYRVANRGYSGTLSGIKIVGAGVDATIIKVVGSHGYRVSAFTMFAPPWVDRATTPAVVATNIEISNLTLEGNKVSANTPGGGTVSEGGTLYGANYTTSPEATGGWPDGSTGASLAAADNYQYGIYVNKASEINIHDLKIRDWWFNGIEVYFSTDVRTDNVLLEYDGDVSTYLGLYSCIEFDNSIARASLTHSTLRSCGTAIMSNGDPTGTNPVRDIIIDDNLIDSCGVGLFAFTWLQDWTVQNNRFLNTGGSPIDFFLGSVVSGKHPRNIVIHHNLLDGFTSISGGAIAVTGQSVTISNNTILQENSAMAGTVNGILVDDTSVTPVSGSSKNNLIIGNLVSGYFPGTSPNGAMVAVSAANTGVSGNNLFSAGSTQIGISIRSSGTTLRGNSELGTYAVNAVNYTSGSGLVVQDQGTASFGVPLTGAPLATLSLSGTSGGSSGYQLTLDTGDVPTYGTLRLGHFSSGAVIGTFAGSNTASDALTLQTGGALMELDHAGNILIGGGHKLDVLTGSVFNIGTTVATGITLAGGTTITTLGGGGAKIGVGGTTISASPRGTATLSTVAILSDTTATQNITVTGAVAGADCAVGGPATLEAGLLQFCYVSATNTVTLRTSNVTGSTITPAGSQTVAVRVFNP